MLNNRWGILTVLFIVRATMAVQFSSLGAVAPLLSSELGFSIADVGILIGLYHAPGIALALPGGAFGQRFGDKATVLGALALMLAGGVLMALAPSWPLQITGRLVAGAGAAMMSVVLTKMLTDWFAGKETATAMAIFINSWPVGIALSLLLLPLLGTRLGVSAVHLGVAAFIGSCMLLLGICYRAPPDTVQSQPASQHLGRGVVVALVTAGLIWGFFNIGFAMIFSFGPSLLVEHGWSIAAAGSAISIVLWISAVTVPLGGFLADRFRRPQQIIVVSCVAFGALLLVLPRSGAVIATVMALGAISGLPAGPIMSLPAKVLQPGTRAIGMGLFFTVFYVCMMLGPAAAGAIGKWAGSAASALDFGAAMILACPLLLWLGNRIPAFTTKPA
jgi:predicted MFS family arabinose efflux permease